MCVDFVVVLVLIRSDAALSLDVLAERPSDVPGETSDEAAVPASSSLDDPDEAGEGEEDEGEPPSEEDDPQQVSGQQVTLRGRRRDRVQCRLGVSGDGSRLLVERRLPDRKSERVLDVDGLGQRRSTIEVSMTRSGRAYLLQYAYLHPACP